MLQRRRAPPRAQRHGAGHLQVRGMAAGSPEEVAVVEEMSSDGKAPRRYSQILTSGRHVLRSARPA